MDEKNANATSSSSVYVTSGRRIGRSVNRHADYPVCLLTERFRDFLACSYFHENHANLDLEDEMARSRSINQFVNHFYLRLRGKI